MSCAGGWGAGDSQAGSEQQRQPYSLRHCRPLLFTRGLAHSEQLVPLEKTPGTSWCRLTSFQLSFGSFVSFSFSFSFDCSLFLPLSFCQDPVTRLRRELRRRITFVPFSALSLFPLSSFLKKAKTILPKEKITGQAQFKVTDEVYQKDCLRTPSLGSPSPGRPGSTSVILENKEISFQALSGSVFDRSHAQWDPSPG